ncbi:trehalose-phosphatase [Methyloligella halotolerans]|uniref:trehalose-phosphatase n=1 Tax=Methyloligella halotolerans TaxID=1177755 RepID=UPI0014719DFD|nr:trehalose-phosphatase [Methyloligella halotolerans]
MTDSAAFFIDFDGTLVEIAPRPHLVEVGPEVLDLLRGLSARLNGAVAILTGRPLATVDGFLSPLTLPAGAEHGAVRRDAEGMVHRDFEADAMTKVGEALQVLADEHGELELERKESSVALHYRQKPELGEIAREAVYKAIEGKPDFHVMDGKMVLEVKVEGLDKGLALEAFMSETPFAGRVPIMIGDDVTDEYAFAAANKAGGISIKIGEGETIAQYRTDRAGFMNWAKAFADAGR